MESELRDLDPEVSRMIRDEINREKNNLVMIASENYTSRAVMDAQASVMTNKYAEGYPGARYYGGCEYVDEVEELAIERAKRLFGAEHANVQPHSGSQANMSIYLGFLKPNDIIMGMDLDQGGHLTHGSPSSFSGMIFRAISYGLDKRNQEIDYDNLRELAKRHRPKILIAGGSAYPRLIDFHRFSEIAKETGALLMVDMAHIAGLIAVGLHPSPVGEADFVTSTTHKTLRGPRGGLILCKEKYGHSVDKAVFPGTQGGPSMHVIAAKAVSFSEALKPEFKEYQMQVLINARVLGEQLQNFGFDLVTGGTDNHLVLIDLTKMGITGRDAEIALGLAGIVTNKNTVPFDKNGPKVTSGLRLGTPALTTRGMREDEIKIIAGWIKMVLQSHDSEDILKKVRNEVSLMCSDFPLYTFL
ncbi:serine hydroxymethyltransferase [Thermodesulfobacteriota bacterium]